MQAKLPKNIQRLIDEFCKLPSIGQKSASRLVFYLLKQDKGTRQRFADSLIKLSDELGKCITCGYFTEENKEKCEICTDPHRDQASICVVEEVMDCIAIDASGGYKGTYHILFGSLNPLEGIGPEKLNIQSLIERCTNQPSNIEVILATNPSLEGEATASFIMRQLIHMDNIKTSRIARGLPFGSHLEYSDQMTLKKALDDRK